MGDSFGESLAPCTLSQQLEWAACIPTSTSSLLMHCCHPVFRCVVDTKPHPDLALEDCILQTNLAELVVRHLERTADGKVRAAYAGQLQLPGWATCLTVPLSGQGLWPSCRAALQCLRERSTPEYSIWTC